MNKTSDIYKNNEAAGRDTGITSIVTLYNTRNTSTVILKYW